MNANDAIDPLKVWAEELKQGHVERRLVAMKKLLTIGSALGVERTKSELLPLLISFYQEEEEEEILFELAAALAKFGPLVGGNEHAYLLLPLLEKLAKEDETIVREKAVESLGVIASKLPAKTLLNDCVPIFKRLSSGEWFSDRVSAAGLFHALYLHVDAKTQTELRQIIASLSRDENPMVRSAVATKLPKIFHVIDRESLKREFREILKRFSADESEAVRGGVFEGALAFMTKVDAAFLEEHLVPLATACVDDKSWRVRLNAAQHLHNWQEICPKHIVVSQVLSALERLLRDEEAEIRITSARTLEQFCADLDEPTRKRIIAQRIIPLLKELSVDSVGRVRESLASVLLRLASVAGKETSSEFLVPVAIVLLKDDSPEVRLNLVSSLKTVGEVVGLKALSTSLVPAILELRSDLKWHVRLSVVDQLPLLAEKLGVEFFNISVNDVCLQLLSDPVFDVREATARALGTLVAHFGSDWFCAQIWPKMSILGKDRNYRRRMTVLHALGHVGAAAATTNQDFTNVHIMPAIMAMSSDKIANIRISVATTLQRLGSLLNGSIVNSHMKPVLEKLKDDIDLDVQDCAKEAILSLGKIDGRIKT